MKEKDSYRISELIKVQNMMKRRNLKTFVIQYIGEVYSLDSKYGQKKLKEYKNKLCTYLMSLSKNEGG